MLHFFDEDLVVMEAHEDRCATSYGPFHDRIVINAVSYTMFCLASLRHLAPVAEQSRIRSKIHQLYGFIRHHQRDDGSWLYSPEGKSFVDCFHSCIVLKNLIKTGRIVALDQLRGCVERGYAYLTSRLIDSRWGLFRRFSIANRPGLVKFDLYDNAEMLQLALLLGDRDLAESLHAAIQRHFCVGADIYSQIDIFSTRKNKNTLRWAVMPYLLAISHMLPSAHAGVRP
jgi:hypothetical protein